PPVSSGVRSAGCNLIATRVVGMSETIAITGKSVKLFKGHYTRCRGRQARALRKGTPRPIRGVSACTPLAPIALGLGL
ncbi:MAG: hypothetical protein ACREYE_03120, partial [Gammaproteobacteria bacterium]